ncbi:hypothetical protein D6779_00595 [Candidatus Parcubacteria bacterium]|nr:MAG: hypothetical protein D6779_00595 [Candidatus Parcubacteria bacterium]
MSKLFISGLRRSGTTIFWNVIRQDCRFRAFNEPFSPEIRKVADPNWRLLRDFIEFRELMLEDPGSFWELYSPIRCTEEIQTGMSDRQKRYLEFLLGSSEHVLIDDTHCQFKLEALKEVAPSLVFVHLFRPPQKFVTSIMLPSLSNMPPHPRALLRTGERVSHKARRKWKETTFWSRKWSENAWGFDEIMYPITKESLFGLRLQEQGMDPDIVGEMPAVGKLLAYWKVNYEHVRAMGSKIFGDRFLSVNLDEYLVNPAPTLESIYRCLGIPFKPLDTGLLKKAKPAFDLGNPKWEELLRTLQMDEWIGA